MKKCTHWREKGLLPLRSRHGCAILSPCLLSYYVFMVAQRTKELQKSEERFDLAMLVANDGIWDLRLDDNTVLYDSRYYTRWPVMRRTNSHLLLRSGRKGSTLMEAPEGKQLHE